MRARCRGSYLEEELERAWGEALETMCQKRYSNHGIGWTYSSAGEDTAIVRFKRQDARIRVPHFHGNLQM